MQVNSNINSLLQLEKKLEESTKRLAKLNNNLDGEGTSTKQQKHTQNSENLESADSLSENETSTEVIPTSAQMPLAYSVNASGISLQNSSAQSILDIKA